MVFFIHYCGFLALYKPLREKTAANAVNAAAGCSFLLNRGEIFLWKRYRISPLLPVFSREP
jgi:hypothetical protein